MNIAVIGTGAWGTALTRLLLGGEHRLTLWDWDQENLREVARTRRNEKYLPGFALEGEFAIAETVEAAAAGADLVLLAVRSSVFREISGRLGDFGGVVVSVTKGIEFETGLTMSGILAETAPKARAVALSGPTLAAEVARGIPTAAVAGSEDEAAARLVQRLFHRPTFRVYTSPDILGVELGGALKNVIAIAAGACDGLGFGDNAKAALITRGLAEMRRLGVACGARAETFSGLSGLGDLIVTCSSRLSRNHTLGERLGRGEKLEAILAGAVTVAEGHPTARSAWRLARKLGVETPIIDEVHAMLYEGKDLKQALFDLLNRESKPED
ncbi:MAG: NAD(P)-dependent glycerol-3-phosphate dehydrogenase [Verrucomicrobia bacterium]|nr:MAG: NAD(P)-dependent glycerol-3-phosphate dehydrogenase [Verrucomicrobiota bacterium]